jgi:hypothetical protein
VADNERDPAIWQLVKVAIVVNLVNLADLGGAFSGT